MSTIHQNLEKGFTQMPDEVLTKKGLSFRAKCIYCLLLHHARQQDTCYPTHECMAAELDTSIDTIKRGLQELKEHGLIEWKQQGLHKPNQYTILPLSQTVQKCTIPTEQECTIHAEQERPTNQTKSKQKIESDEDSSKKPLKGRKDEVCQRSKPKPERVFHLEGKPITQDEIDDKRKKGLNISGMTPLSHIIPPEHWHELERQQRHVPSSTTTHFSVCTKNSPLFIDAIMEQFTPALGDAAENTAQNINRAAKLYRDAQREEDAFRDIMYDAFNLAKRYPAASIQKKRQDGRPNRMPVFFAILQERLQEPET
jgi:hypothetical protein